MPKLPFITGVARVRLLYSDGDGNWGSRFFTNYGTGVPSASQLHSYAIATANNWEAHLAAIVSVSYSLVEVDVTDIGSDIGFTASWTGTEPGALTGHGLSSNVTTDMQMPIPQHYRGGHPVMHLPPGRQEDLVTGRQYNASFVGTAAAAMQAWASAQNAATILSGQPTAITILRGYRSGALPSQVTQYIPSSYNCRPYLGTMRKRAKLPR